MGRLAGFSGHEVARVAERDDWQYQRRRGSHMIYSKVGVRENLSIPNPSNVKEGTLRDLLTIMEMTVGEFLAVARK